MFFIEFARKLWRRRKRVFVQSVAHISSIKEVKGHSLDFFLSVLFYFPTFDYDVFSFSRVAISWLEGFFIGLVEEVFLT